MGFSYIIPPSIEKLGEEYINKFADQMETMQTWYDEWSNLLGEGEMGNQDARFVLPNAAETKMLVTMNANALMNFFNLRCCQRAQWEIRALADEMLIKVKKATPHLFKTCGPTCLTRPCQEGKFSCGRMKEMRIKYGVKGEI